ncbi:hypothetical protein [Agrococcus sp. SGAir0287]|uniref:hypothetical protein n=1 Tax=Agrococcus sp. SGAir0287 TaxID=2070347 RepID=UPI0010CD4C07|nr:hypothetical protein [Agrococcus sp. SGAir0287]QCR19716.1 hypothetical protein C1N71_10010 [Agrococcus sp. SGAir0287]
MPRSRALVAVLAASSALALAACSPGALDADPQPPSPSPSLDASGEPIPSDPNPSNFDPAPSDPLAPGPVAGDLDLACDDVLTPDQVYAFNPEMLATATPASGIPADLDAYAESGVLCAWQHATSGDVLLVGVLEDVDDAPSPTSLPGRSAVVDGWGIVVASRYFEGDDAGAQALLDEVAANLG